MLVGWGDTYLAGNVDINGPAWIDNDISVYGPANFMGGAEVSDQLTVNGPTVLGDSLEVYNGAVAFGALDVYGSVTATSPDGGTPALNVDGPGMYGACISMGNDTWRIAQDQTSNDLLFVKSSGTTFTPLRLMDESFNDAIVAAAGGVGIGKSNPATMLDVNGTVTATGLTATGSLSLPTGSVTSAFILDGGVQAADLNDGVTTRAWQQITFDDSYPFIGPDPYFWGLYGLSQIEITPPRAGGYFVLTFTGTFYDSMGPTTTPVDGHFHLCHRSQAGMVNILPYVGDPLYVNVGDPFGTPTYKYQFNVHITRTLPNVWGSGQQTFCLFGWDTAWYDDWSFGGTFTVEWKPGSATQQSWP